MPDAPQDGGERQAEGVRLWGLGLTAGFAKAMAREHGQTPGHGQRLANEMRVLAKGTGCLRIRGQVAFRVPHGWLS